jgi:predicted ATPase/DNA-binding SARP family transcriptional activator
MLLLHISLLGPLQVKIGETPAPFRTDAERALLAYLALNQGVPQRRDTLAGLLSPDRPDADALTYLRNRLTRLRAALGNDAGGPAWLDVDRKQITLRGGDDILIDVTRFDQLLATVERHAHRQLAGCPTCLAGLQAATDLVRGELLAGLNFPSDTWEAWLVGLREHYQQRALAALTLLRTARVERGEWQAVIEVAQRQLRLEPWLEEAHRALMQAHYRLGDRNAALAQYDQCVQQLWAELAVEPEAETQQLRQQIFASALAVTVSAEISDNLPLQTGPFFGRQREQTHLLRLLVDPKIRLVTLVGTGGSGKTRLALEVGQQLKTSFPDGVWFVRLDAVQGGAEGVKIAVGEALGFSQGAPGGAGKQVTGEAVLTILRSKRLLLILDNCEPLLDELAFLPAWLQRAPGLTLLATAREPLNFSAEAVVLLAGLPTGEGETSAAEALFAERGRMARADFVVAADNLLQVRQICEQVDGLPLGIALAAAWLRRRSLAQISHAIDQSLDFLSTGLRDVEPRHRSMRAVFETSWQLLDEGTQGMLAGLAVFPTSFSAHAAEQVAGATDLTLDLLCEKSLLQQQHEAERYLMHSLLRQFAAEKLATRTPEVNRAFVEYFYHFACEHGADYAALQPEWRNLAAAITHAHGLAAWQTVLDFLQVLDEPWFRQIRFSEMRAGLALALAAATALADDHALARTLLRLGEIEMEQNEYGVAETHLSTALGHFMRLEDSLGIAHAKHFRGRIKHELAQDEQAVILFEESMRLFEDEGDQVGIAKNLNLIAICHIRKSRDFATAQAYLEEAVALQRTLPPSATYVATLRNLAWVKGWAEAYAEAERCLAEAANISRQLNDLGEYAAVLYDRVVLCKLRQQWDEALAFGYECLANFRTVGSLRWEALIKTQLGLLHQAKGEPVRALALLTEGLHSFHDLGDGYEQAYSYYYLHKLYAEIGETAQSHQAKEQALRLNRELNDPQLREKLIDKTNKSRPIAE